MGDVKSNAGIPKTGGFAGTAWDDTVKLEKCHAGGKITATDDGTVGGLIGYDHGVRIIIFECSFDNVKLSLIHISEPTRPY